MDFNTIAAKTMKNALPNTNETPDLGKRANYRLGLHQAACEVCRSAASFGRELKRQLHDQTLPWRRRTLKRLERMAINAHCRALAAGEFLTGRFEELVESVAENPHVVPSADRQSCPPSPGKASGKRLLKPVRVLPLVALLAVCLAASAVEPHSGLALMDSVDTMEKPTDSQQARRPVSGTVGLVLSGGGAKGIAHVGIIKALEDNDIPIDYVAGTSMGAIVGSLYSCGWSPARMREFFTAPDFHYWATGEINPKDVFYFSQRRPTPQWVGFNLSFDKKNDLSDQVLPSSLVSPLPMNIEFLKLFTPYTLLCRENFNDLFVPYRCVTSDIYHKHKVVLSHGSLGDAVRASMSFPMVYRPIEINGLLMFDGGIYDNFPVDVMHDDFDPDFIIGVSVSAPDKKPQPGNLYGQLEDMIIQNNDYTVPPSQGIKIQVPVLDFGVLDFSQAEEIYEIGYRTGLSMVDSIKSRLASRRPLAEVEAHRSRFAQRVPEVEFDSVKVTGATPGQARFLSLLFTDGRPGPFGLERTQNGYYRAIAGGKLNNLLPQMEPHLKKDSEMAKAQGGSNPVESANTLLLEAQVKNPWNVGIGGWITSSTNSLLYLTFGYHTLSMNSLDVDASFWLGQSYGAARVGGRMELNSAIPSSVGLEGVVSRQKYFGSDILFYETSTPSVVTETEHFLRANYSLALGREGKATAEVTWGEEKDKFLPLYGVHFKGSDYEKNTRRVVGLNLKAERNTLDNELYPSRGILQQVALHGTREQLRMDHGGGLASGRGFQTRWRGRAKAAWKQFFGLTSSRSLILGGSAEATGTLARLGRDYTSEVIQAPGFAPTPSTKSYFNPAFRADNYVTCGLIPIWQPMNHLQLRGDFHLFLPVRNLERTASGAPRWDGWFRNPQFVGELAAVYNFKFASLSIYGNYLSSPARNWNFGVNFGLYFLAPKLLRP